MRTIETSKTLLAYWRLLRVGDSLILVTNVVLADLNATLTRYSG